MGKANCGLMLSRSVLPSCAVVCGEQLLNKHGSMPSLPPSCLAQRPFMPYTCPLRIILQGLKRQELRDELYMQLVKQTRSNPSIASRCRAWALFHLVASAMPPSKEFTGLISEYVHTALQVSGLRVPGACPAPLWSAPGVLTQHTRPQAQVAAEGSVAAAASVATTRVSVLTCVVLVACTSLLVADLAPAPIWPCCRIWTRLMRPSQQQQQPWQPSNGAQSVALDAQ